MRYCRTLLVVALISMSATHVSAQSVSESDGNLFFNDAFGNSVQLTRSGLDFAPSLSPNGKLVVFVRHTPGQQVHTGLGDVEAHEIWVVGVDGRHAHRLVRGKEDATWKSTLADLDKPQFLSDSRRVAFESGLAAVTDRVYLVDVKTGRVRRVTDGNDSKSCGTASTAIT